jgi:DNA-binding NarL/FixJ family response regulator
MPIHVSIVEDDAGIRESLSALIAQEPGFCLAAAYGDAETAIQNLPENASDVVLMDINLPGMSGVECVRQLKPAMPQTQFIMNTVYEDNDRLFDSLRAGASGYLLKRSPSSRILESVREAHEGGAPMTPQLARRLVQHFQTPSEVQTSEDRPENPEMATLSPREKDVLEQLAKGYQYKEITEKLGISLHTVRGHIRNIYEKLHVHSRTDAVLKFLKRDTALS